MPPLKIISPIPNATFLIARSADWPSISFKTDGTGSHVWNWDISWGPFKQTGSQTTPSNVWDASSVVVNYGGTLSVRVQAGGQTALISVKIKADGNPSSGDVTQFLATKPDSAGFDQIVIQETKCRHFNGSGEPIKSFDNGYGMCQLTNPQPSFAQIWNWKLNLQAGLQLFANKRKEAIAYLGQSGRSYTDSQLKYESVCRWNSGRYHEWDEKTAAWVRNPNLLCDSATGNIGWDMTDSENTGKTEDDLHKRDKSSYGSPPDASAHWKYSGVCYADKVLG